MEGRAYEIPDSAKKVVQAVAIGASAKPPNYAARTFDEYVKSEQDQFQEEAKALNKTKRHDIYITFYFFL